MAGKEQDKHLLNVHFVNELLGDVESFIHKDVNMFSVLTIGPKIDFFRASDFVELLAEIIPECSQDRFVNCVNLDGMRFRRSFKFVAVIFQNNI